MFWSKPTVGSVCGGMCGGLPSPLSTIRWNIVTLYILREICHWLPRRYIYVCHKKSVAFWQLADDLEERHMFRSKPTVGSVCGGICGGLPSPLSTIRQNVVTLYTFREIRHRLPRRYICICYKKSVAFWWLAEDLEEHGVFLKKHHEMPFLKEYAVLFHSTD